MKLVLGASLPGDAESYLPTVEDVVRAMSGGHPDDANPHLNDVSEELSGSPARPASPGDGPPLPGEEGFEDFLLDAVRREVITTGEALERQRVHQLIVQAGAA